MELFKTQLDGLNPFVKQYRIAASIINHSVNSPLRLCLLRSQNTDGRIFNTPTTSEVAILVVGDFDSSFSVRVIIIEKHLGEL